MLPIMKKQLPNVYLFFIFMSYLNIISYLSICKLFKYLKFELFTIKLRSKIRLNILFLTLNNKIIF